MRIARFVPVVGRSRYGIIEGDEIHAITGTPFSRNSGRSVYKLEGSRWRLDEVRFLTPSLPTKVVCIGLNYRSHVQEAGLDIPSQPLIFLKPPSAVINHEGNILLPEGQVRVEYEGELGIVIGKKGKNISEADIHQVVLGYTCFNDLSERIAQQADGQWTRGKGYDTFAPVGPWVETDLDPGNLKIETRLNGLVKQSGHTSDLIFSVAKIVSFISKVMTLLPGDIIATGTPSGVGPMKNGDIVEVRIENIGSLKNYVGGNHV